MLWGGGDDAVVFAASFLNIVEKPQPLKYEASSPSSEAQDVMAMTVITNQSIFGMIAL